MYNVKITDITSWRVFSVASKSLFVLLYKIMTSTLSHKATTVQGVLQTVL